ncbi:EamA family transporter [Maritalea sp.]|jgi:transporter family protein|uniref:EamA family transporter n=1 Tax=Maritalea sp. TaxID=2003361 RepID=UPI0039E3CC5D
MSDITTSWQTWAILAAFFAAATAIFAKIGVTDINSNFATLIRTVVVVVGLTLLIVKTGEYQPLNTLSGKTILFLILSGLATGASWLCYFKALQIGQAAQVAPVDKLSVVFVAVLGALFLGESLSIAAWFGVAMIAAGAILVATN